ncbi:ABC transporter ATP-binding protein [Dechloromonas sp. A34]|uniref:ABC transporter ATP-binding protein n=1 Tax=Dechloromonas sp. A34 TaxID=447588 RepID=UPI002249174A|nr:ABC transporter ATP-binding protein [Dechloromonas sp. A34]
MSSEAQEPIPDEIAISVRNLTKSYRLFNHPGDRIKEFFSLGLKRYNREFTALRDVSLEVRKGETIGIIGRNGSGKSTLLQVICGILKPTAGTVQVHGRISALLELGAGFNPEFTGRENAYFQGALQGFSSAQMEERFAEIAAFADIGDYIDQPVRTYSSGMFVRLSFSVAVHVDPDLLVIDEALAVGDMEFQQRCFEKIRQMQETGITIIVVSHNPYQLERLCHRAAVLHQGSLSRLYPAKETLTLYQNLVHQAIGVPKTGAAALREGTQLLYFEHVSIVDLEGKPLDIVKTGQPIRFVLLTTATQPITDVRFRIEICSAANEIVTLATTIGLTEELVFNGKRRLAFDMPNCQLTSGWYYINAVASGRDLRLDTWQRACEIKVLLEDPHIRNLSTDAGNYVCHGRWRID